MKSPVTKEGKGKQFFYPASRKQWRTWLQKNHTKKQSVWLVCYKIKSGRPSITWSDAVDEALCFGWIDSTRKSVNDEMFVQFFSKRKPSSTWSKINKAKIKRLNEAGQMTPAGMASIETAKRNGSWTILDEVEKLTIPQDLEKAFKTKKGSKNFFQSLSKSVRKMILQWVMFAKREETRQKRVNEIATRAAKKLKPRHIS
jgi:uncharacterized protein YdeI (YjbR/CyaY-like superfamily)